MKFQKIEKHMLKISLIFSILGIIVLTVMPKTPGEITQIEDLTKKDLGRTITTQGIIENIKTLPTITIITLKNKESIKVVLFDPNNKIKKGDKVKITGKVKLYKNELEIIADKITN